MSKKSVFCIANTSAQAEEIVSHLKLNGFTTDDISVLFPDKQSSHEFAHQKNTKAPEGIATGATAGGIVGGVTGWLAGVGTLLIPGVGPILAIGQIVAALSVAAVGATVGGITGGLIGLGIPELEAKRFEGRINAGNYLIAVHTEDSDDIAKAETIFKQGNATDVCTTTESTVKAKDKAPRGEPVAH